MDKRWLISGIALVCVSAGMFTGCTSSGAEQITPSNPLIIDMSEEGQQQSPTTINLTQEEQDYIGYVLNLNLEVGELHGSLLNGGGVADAEQLVYIRDELKTKTYPVSMSDIYQAQSDFMKHITTSGWFLLDSTYAVDKGDIENALTYMEQAKAEYDTAIEALDLLTLLIIERVPELALIDMSPEPVSPPVQPPAAETTEPVSPPAETGPSATTGEKNALLKAKAYLDMSAFSYDGLVEQLEYEGFSHEEAVYGADNCGANWNEQAARKAKAYLDMSAFSYDGLVEQLEYEGFSHKQAVYGAEANY